MFTSCGAPRLWISAGRKFREYCSDAILWTAGRWSFRANDVGCSNNISQESRRAGEMVLFQLSDNNCGHGAACLACRATRAERRSCLPDDKRHVIESRRTSIPAEQAPRRRTSPLPIAGQQARNAACAEAYPGNGPAPARRRPLGHCSVAGPRVGRNHPHLSLGRHEAQGASSGEDDASDIRLGRYKPRPSPCIPEEPLIMPTQQPQIARTLWPPGRHSE